MLLAGILALLAFAGPAEAAFPGQNGKVAFIDPRSQISTVYPDGTNVSLLAAEGVYSFSPHWSPDGSKLVFASPETGDSPAQVYIVNADGSGLHVIAPGVAGDGSDPSWSADGTKLVVRGSGGIDVLNPDGTGRATIPNTMSVDRGPVWSPDGSKIAFEREPDSARSDIYSIEADGTALTNLTSANVLSPGSIRAGEHSVLQTFRVRVNDSGVDGVRGNADDRTFAAQGIYIP